MEYIVAERGIKFIFLGKNIILIELPNKSLSYIYKINQPHRMTSMRERLYMSPQLEEYISDLIETYHQTGENLPIIATKLDIMDEHYFNLRDENFLNLLLHKTKSSNNVQRI